MVKKYNLFLESNQYISEYILGIPSGEIIYIKNREDLNILIRKDIIRFENRVNDQSVNCYCFNDDKKHLVINYLNMDSEIPHDKINICSDFQKEISRIIGKRVAIGYMSLFGYSYYYAIIPDLNINKRFYELKKEELDHTTNRMQRKYLFSHFYYKEKMINDKMKYLM